MIKNKELLKINVEYLKKIVVKMSALLYNEHQKKLTDHIKEETNEERNSCCA